ncbi:flagellar basal-body MS-ring/collar protein FliF [Acerihabitans sp. TG2]|uniref:flagellar basal-body MS-ring/collar protein FliF n=1 Tax=Acerihabitans sp. TG2 TaxID=3096008 RepID=UPI002B2330A8|nr:flagellar basal-body MS-ring/collar protein FliF [Acerihabitans sp. TG2]MEA9392584.1 flagellar basal-body MS-ring/collar protein FliF [Acerihabitans sp. TG2]
MSTAKNGSGVQGKNLFAPLLERLRIHPKVFAAIAAAATIAIVVVLALWAKSPDYRVLYSNISDRDGGDIVTQLTQMNIPFRFEQQGTAILVPADSVHETRLKLAALGLPKGGAVGFELLDQEKFGISQFSEQVNYQRALEGELARTIETLGPVLSARVHLAQPKPSLFVREQKSPSASVTLNLQPGRALDDGQVNAIVYMVSSSVAGLPPGNVTVLDQQGHLLTQSDSTGRGLNASQLKFTNELESRYQRRIETILAPMVGSGNVHAQVTAQIDFDSQERTEEQYKPNAAEDAAAIRSKQVTQSEQLGASSQGGVPGALSNQPSATPTAPINRAAPATPAAGQGTAANAQSGQNAPATAGAQTGTQKSTPSNTRHEETINYELDHTVRHVKRSEGNLERLSVAVVVNYAPGEKGKAPVPLSAEQLKQIDDITREAMGFSTERGDSLNVVNTEFVQTDDLGGALPFWQQAFFINGLISAGRWLLVLLVAWILWRKVVKPLMPSRTSAAVAPAAPPTAARTVDDGVAKQTKDQQEEKKRSQQRENTETRVQRVREMTDQDPQIVALVIRQWMSTEQ